MTDFEKELSKDVREIRGNVLHLSETVGDAITEMRVHKVKAGFWGSFSGFFTTVGVLVGMKLKGWF